MVTDDRQAALARQAELRERHLRPPASRAATTGAGIHHAAFVCDDVEATIRFYQDLLGFPLVELVENRDYPGSTHFFFDVGHGNLLGFFDFPGLGLARAVEAIGGVQHVAISVGPEQHARLRARLDEAGVGYLGPDRGVEESLYLRDPNGVQIELYREDLGVFDGRPLL
ncbi:MAG: VOC family protein [Mycobacterium leprae]